MVEHNGYTFTCESGRADCSQFVSGAETRRTAVAHARAAGWFIGAIRIVGGLAKRRVRTKRITYCARCKWRVGA
jgi:hypothetical protein